MSLILMCTQITAGSCQDEDSNTVGTGGRVLWTELCLTPPHSYFEVLTLKVSVFGDRALKEQIIVK